MKRHYIFVCFLVILAIASCKKENNSVYLPKFEGITVREGLQTIPIQNDPDDWRLDVKFSQVERSLFDTLNFDNIASKENLFVESESESNYIPYIPDRAEPVFYPNPVSNFGYFHHNAGEINNLVIVNKSFKKLIEVRSYSNMYAFDFREFPKGIYRVYYVFQNTNYQITGMGYGDIAIGMTDMFFGE